MSEDRDKGIEALRQVYRYADQEKRIAARQADEAKAAKDYRASDRHYMYSKAMAKICGKVSDLARRTFLIDVTIEESSTWEHEQFRDEYDPENDCPRCQGSGTVVTADYESYFGDQFKTCPECGGNRTRA